MRLVHSILIAALTIIGGQSSALACPTISGLPDYNCDGRLVVAFLGDSLVYGIGDKENKNKGGYVRRAQELFPDATFHNFGEPGATAAGVVLDIVHAFERRPEGKLAVGLSEADLIVVDVGRNDLWSLKTPLATSRNLKRIRALLAEKISERTGVSPLVVTAVLMIPRRLRQAPWIDELNDLLQATDSPRAPADLRFDRVGKNYLSADRIHPSSQGYQKLATVFAQYMTKDYRLHVKDLLADVDRDGLYDRFERSRFGTDPSNPDTDGDGILDGTDPEPLQ